MVDENDVLEVKWINDSSCVVKFPSEKHSKQAYQDLKLSEARMDDQLPPLENYLQDLRESQNNEQKKKDHNPDYDTLFGGEQEQKEEMKNEFDLSLNVVVDPRNFEQGIGFIDVMGYKLKLPPSDQHTEPWQNLWLRFATDQDKKCDKTLGKNSRFYKFVQNNKPRQPFRKLRSNFKKDQADTNFDKKKNLKEKLVQIRKRKQENQELEAEDQNSDDDADDVEADEDQNEGEAEEAQNDENDDINLDEFEMN